MWFWRGATRLLYTLRMCVWYGGCWLGQKRVVRVACWLAHAQKAFPPWYPVCERTLRGTPHLATWCRWHLAFASRVVAFVSSRALRASGFDPPTAPFVSSLLEISPVHTPIYTRKSAQQPRGRHFSVAVRSCVCVYDKGCVCQ
jgi:hypothetical protein